MNPSHLTLTHFESRIDDARRRADAAALLARSARSARGRERRPSDYAEHVVIRSGAASDDAELARLAELDGGHVPGGPTLVAELHGRVVAAISLDGRRAIADPFTPTGDIARLLELRARQLSTAERGSADGDIGSLGHGAVNGRPSGLVRFMRGGRHALGA